MKRFGFLFILMFIISACGQAPTPTATPDVQGTAAVYANTMVAATLTAQPTATLAPTATSTPTTPPTDTQPVPNTASGTATPDATQAVGIGPQATPTMFFGTTTAGNTNNLDTAVLLIQNLSGEKVVYVTLTCHTAKGAVITYNVSVSKTTVLQYVICSYSVLVQIPNKRYMSISFAQTNKDKSTLSIYLTKLAVHGP